VVKVFCLLGAYFSDVVLKGNYFKFTLLFFFMVCDNLDNNLGGGGDIDSLSKINFKDKKNKNVNFRSFVLESGRVIYAGKDSCQNDLIVSLAKKNDVLLHTKNPGSPFVNLGEDPTSNEISQGAVFCALKSKDFRDNQRDVVVNVFLKRDCYKDKSMKLGTWGVKKNIDNIKVKKVEILKMRKSIESFNINTTSKK
jgi:predicted ribosome quality control (RQC) complex YloA/Tae2 family protein